MSTSRHFRCVTSLITLFSLLFMQLPVAAYTCPGEMPAPERAGLAYGVPGTLHEAPSNCAGMDMEQPSLCHAHGQTGNQSLDKPEPPQVPPFVPASLVHRDGLRTSGRSAPSSSIERSFTPDVRTVPGRPPLLFQNLTRHHVSSAAAQRARRCSLSSGGFKDHLTIVRPSGSRLAADARRSPRFLSPSPHFFPSGFSGTGNAHLDRARQLAVSRSRQLAAQDFAVSASRELAIAAAQLLDPVLKMGLDKLPAGGADRFSLTGDFMTMRRVGLMQELTRSGKRQLRTAAFEREAEMRLAEKDLAIANIETRYRAGMAGSVFRRSEGQRQERHADMATWRLARIHHGAPD